MGLQYFVPYIKVPLSDCTINDDDYVAMAGIDFSAAFDIVDVDLLIKRLAFLIQNSNGQSKLITQSNAL